MLVEEYFSLLREVKDVAIATVDKNGNPQVRVIDIMLTDSASLYFLTARGKEFYSEIINNPTVAITGLTKNWESIRMMGEVVKVDQKLLTPIFENNPSMNEVYPNDTRKILEVFCLKDGYGEYFNLGNHPIYRTYFSFGEGKVEEKGYLINDTCISCDICRKNCPQDCINEGLVYEIVNENCLHCGLCFELCPVDAIERKGI